MLQFALFADERPRSDPLPISGIGPTACAMLVAEITEHGWTTGQQAVQDCHGRDHSQVRHDRRRHVQIAPLLDGVNRMTANQHRVPERTCASTRKFTRGIQR